MKNNLEYFICPVRGITDELKNKIESIVREREAQGVRVHFPPRDVDQNDPTGLRICSDHRAAMCNAFEVDIWHDPTSQGSVFDTGMGFYAKKPLKILNGESLEKITNDYEHFLIDYLIQGILGEHVIKPSAAYLKMEDQREHIRQVSSVEYFWKPNDWEALFIFGMIFMSEKPILLLNREDVEKQRTPHKSYQNVLLTLDDMYRNKVQ